MSSIFISHKNVPHDNAWAERIHAWIKNQKGIDGFLDFDVQDGLQAGDRWEDEIYAAMNRAQVVIALVSPDWLASDWCMSEARMAKLRGLKLIPLIIAECSFPFRDIQAIRLEKKGEERAFEELRQALRTTHKLPAQPYPGLVAFEEKDAAVFFGREDETRDLANMLDSLFRGSPETPRLLLVLGASGSGKSSLLRAGLIPEFKAEERRLCIEPIIPRGAPLGKLGYALGVTLDGLAAAAAAEAILASLEGASPGYRRALISIDQAEELLRGDQCFFFDVLRRVLDKGEGRVIALATMRSDFLNAFQQSGLIGAGSDLDYDTFTLDPLPQDRLSDIIQKPAKLFSVDYEEGLIARIMQDHGGPDALPLLAFFLNEFWRKDYIRDGVLQLAEYESFGGVNKALQKAVDRALADCAKLDPAYSQRKALLDDLREVFLGLLVSISSASGEAVRNRAPAAALTDRQASLLAAFAQQRLLIEKDGEWEVAHEALMRQWADLGDWIETAREDLITIDRVQSAAIHWREAGREDADLTHTGNRLSEAVTLLRSPRYEGRFTQDDRDYIAACEQRDRDQLEKERALREQAERERASAEAQRAQAETERARARKGEGRARRFTTIAALVAVLAICTGLVALWQWGQARQEARRALDNQRLGYAALSEAALSSGRPPEAVMLALAAWPRRPDARDDLSERRRVLTTLGEAGAAMLEMRRFEGHTEQVTGIAFTPDGARLITSDGGGAMHFWNPETGDETARFRAPVGWIFDIAVSPPDGAKIAMAGQDGSLRIWDIATRREMARLDGHDGAVASVAFSPDGTRVASGGYDGTVRIWDLAVAREVARMEGHRGWVRSLAFSPDGVLLATAGDDGTSRLWDVATAQQTARLQDNGEWIGSVAFSPDGTLLAVGGNAGVVGFWDVATSRQTTRLETDMGAIYAVAFSPDGTRLATGSADGAARVWDVAKGRETLRLSGHRDWVTEVAFSPDSGHLVTGSRDGTARLWDLPESRGPGRQLMGFEADRDWVRSAVFSPDGTWLATGGNDGAPRIWDLATGREIARLKGHLGAVGPVVFSPDGTLLATGSIDLTAIVWNTATGAEVRKFSEVGGRVNSLSFSPDGAQLATAGLDGVARLWDVATGLETAQFDGPSGELFGVAFSPDGSSLATAGLDGVARVWDLTSGKEALKLVGHVGQIWSLAFSPDGTRLATGGDDRSTRVWDLATGEETARIDGPARVYNLAFSPNGTRLATIGNAPALLWDLATASLIARLDAEGRKIWSVDFSPDGSRLATGSTDGAAQLWNVDYGPGNLFEVLCRRLPTRSPPAILETYGIVLDEPICSGEEPLPPLLPMEAAQ